MRCTTFSSFTNFTCFIQSAFNRRFCLHQVANSVCLHCGTTWQVLPEHVIKLCYKYFWIWFSEYQTDEYLLTYKRVQMRPKATVKFLSGLKSCLFLHRTTTSRYRKLWQLFKVFITVIISLILTICYQGKLYPFNQNVFFQITLIVPRSNNIEIRFEGNWIRKSKWDNDKLNINTTLMKSLPSLLLC